MTVHDAARGFEHAADAYERGRPEYPNAAIDLLVGANTAGRAEVGLAYTSDVFVYERQ